MKEKRMRMSIIVLLETLILKKLLASSVSCYFMYNIKYKTGPCSKLILTAIGILTLYTLMDFSFWFETINLGRFIVNIKGSQVIIPK